MTPWLLYVRAVIIPGWRPGSHRSLCCDHVVMGLNLLTLHLMSSDFSPPLAPPPHWQDRCGGEAGDQLLPGYWWLSVITVTDPRSSSLTHSNCDMGMSHQGPSKALTGRCRVLHREYLNYYHEDRGQKSFVPSSFPHQDNEHFLNKTTLLGHSLDMQICSVTHSWVTHWGFYRVIKSHQRSCWSQWAVSGPGPASNIASGSDQHRPAPVSRAAPARPGPHCSVVSRMSQSEHLSAACPG